jgi:hypothetical protein
MPVHTYRSMETILSSCGSPSLVLHVGEEAASHARVHLLVVLIVLILHLVERADAADPHGRPDPLRCTQK